MFGGFLIGIGSQIFILPYSDSIAGFVVLFVIVTALSSWFITSSPRLSYFGMQAAVAFYLINLDGFKMQYGIYLNCSLALFPALILPAASLPIPLFSGDN